jgi:hypothetical protein
LRPDLSVPEALELVRRSERNSPAGTSYHSGGTHRTMKSGRRRSITAVLVVPAIR